MEWNEFITELKKSDKETKVMFACLAAAMPVIYCLMWVIGAMAGRA